MSKKEERMRQVRRQKMILLATGIGILLLVVILGMTLAGNKKKEKEMCIRDRTRTYTLMSFQIGEGSDGLCKTVAEDMDSIQMFIDGKIYYLADVNESAGELYCNEEHIDSDVFVGSLENVKDGVAYAVDYDSNKGRACLLYTSRCV